MNDCSDFIEPILQPNDNERWYYDHGKDAFVITIKTGLPDEKTIALEPGRLIVYNGTALYSAIKRYGGWK